MLIVHKIKDMNNFSYHINCPKCGKPYFNKQITDKNNLIEGNLPAVINTNNNDNSFTVECCHLSIKYIFPEPKIKEIDVVENLSIENGRNIKLLNDNRR